LRELQNNERYRRMAIYIACLCLVLSCLPYLAGLVASSEEMQFGGVLLLHMEDVYTYLSAMHQGADGSWCYHILHTPEEHQSEHLKLFYLALGKLAHALHIPMVVAYQLTRIIAGICLIAAIYAFTGYFVKDARSRLIAFVLACVGGGLGWLLPLLKALGCRWADWPPIEFWLVEGFTFPTILVFAHGALATAIMLVTFLAVLRYQHSGTRRGLLRILTLTIALGFVQPLCLPILATTLCAYLAILSWSRWRAAHFWMKREEFVVTLLVGATSLVLAVYFLHPFLTNPAFRAWETQSPTPSPPPIQYIWGYGLIIPLAIVGAVRILQQKQEDQLFLIAWVLMGAILLYLPYLPQRRFAQGLIIPLACLAALGMERLCGKVERGWTAFACRLVIYLTVISSVAFVVLHTKICLSKAEPVFHPKEELQAIAWLAENSTSTETVLTGPRKGAFIPAAIGHRVFWGHWSETLHLERKRGEIAEFFNHETPDEWRCRFLQRYDIRYLLYGPWERAQGGFEPAQAPYLIKRFQAGEYTIYEVEQSCNSLLSVGTGRRGMNVCCEPFYLSVPTIGCAARAYYAFFNNSPAR